MLNRKIVVGVEKTDKSKDIASEQPDITFEEKVELINRSFERITRKIGFAVCAYVVLDTLRKIAVASVTE